MNVGNTEMRALGSYFHHGRDPDNLFLSVRFFKLQCLKSLKCIKPRCVVSKQHSHHTILSATISRPPTFVNSPSVVLLQLHHYLSRAIDYCTHMFVVAVEIRFHSRPPEGKGPGLYIAVYISQPTTARYKLLQLQKLRCSVWRGDYKNKNR